MYRGRFAPSPTGQLHFGSLIAALGSWLRARSRNGVWLVRIEDIDPPREVPGAARDILETLAAFGMVSDEPVLWQSSRFDAYTDALASLHESGDVFPCWCSRSQLDIVHGIHGDVCAASPDTSRPPAWRLRAPTSKIGFIDALQGAFAQSLAREVGAYVIKRVEGYFAYQLAVVVDDAFQGVTEVVRGADLLDSTPRQLWLQHRLGLATPRYAHLPLVLGEDGRKLSKQEHARPIDRGNPLPALRAALQFLGLPTALVHQAGVTPEGLLTRAVNEFDFARTLLAAVHHATT